jgi:hypothetical protein
MAVPAYTYASSPRAGPLAPEDGPSGASDELGNDLPVMKEIVLVRLAINPQTGTIDPTAPFVVIPQRRELQHLPGRGGIYEKEPGVIEQFRPGEREAQFEAEWSKQHGGWIFGKRVIDS